MAKISVILPIIDNAVDIDRTIYSILCQNYTDFELIVASKVNINLDKFTDERIKFYKSESNKIPALLNEVLDIVNSEYTCFVDENDVLMFYALKQRIEQIENDNLIASYGLGFDSDEEFEPFKNETFNMFFSFENLPENNLVSLLQMELYPTLSSLMIKTDVIKSLLFNTKYKVCFIWDLTLKLMTEYPNQLKQVNDPIYISGSEYAKLIELKRNYPRLFLNETLLILDKYFNNQSESYTDIRNSCFSNTFLTTFFMQKQYFANDFFLFFLIINKYIQKNIELKGGLLNTYILSIFFNNLLTIHTSQLTKAK